MKRELAIIFVCILSIDSDGLASNHHGESQKPKALHPGDTVFPGSEEWVDAGSPRNTITGEETILICGTDGKLRPVGYAIEDTDGSWVAPTEQNRERIEDRKEKKRLEAAVREIERESPDRIIMRPAKAHRALATRPDTGYDPYKFVMHWADSIGKAYDDPDFLQEMEQYYRLPNNGLGLTPYDDPLRD